MVLTLQLSYGKEKLDVVLSICYTWMFDETTVIKPQECAGIQILCEYIISSIIHLPVTAPLDWPFKH